VIATLVRYPAARRACALAAAALVTGCATTGPASPDDPLEPMNRALYGVHDAVDTAVVRPIAQAYVDVVPQLMRQGVSNVFNNINDFFSGVNGILQGKLDKAGDDVGRVLLNTGFGLGGLFDLASMMGIERGNEDFGQTFGVWGFPQGPYLFVPLFGPTTVRDGAGVVVRVVWGPNYYVNDEALRWSLYGIGYLDLRAEALDASKVVDTAALDRYTFIRNAYLQRRRYLVYDGKPPPEKEE
jgi:phospholipid-binding lipoprotein MlaA